MNYYEDYQYAKNKKQALYRAKRSAKARGGKKCKDCGLYGCVCQMTLPDTLEEEEIKKEDWLAKVTRKNKKRKNKYRPTFK